MTWLISICRKNEKSFKLKFRHPYLVFVVFDWFDTDQVIVKDHVVKHEFKGGDTIVSVV